MAGIRVGSGYDVHQLVAGRPLIIGGVQIPHHKGALGHSDADVLLHAMADALLGAAGLGDIGSLFPDIDPSYKNIDSSYILKSVVEKVEKSGWSIGNIDATIVLQTPKIASYIDAMKQKVAPLLGIAENDVSIKATTTEHLGFAGREEGIAAYATVLIFK